MKVKKIKTLKIEAVRFTKNPEELVKAINKLQTVYAHYSRHTDTIYIHGDTLYMAQLWSEDLPHDWNDDEIVHETINVAKGNFKNYFANNKNIRQVA